MMKPSVFLYCLCLPALLSCERRPLTYPEKEVGLVIETEWNGMRPYRDEKQQHIKVLFYPVDGSKPIERLLTNADRERVTVPEGDYHIIVYNWRTNAEVQTTKIRNRDSYFAKKAYTDQVARSKVKTRQETGQPTNEAIIEQPGHLYAWTTRNTPRQLSLKDAKEDVVIKAPMKSKVFFYHFTVSLYNLGNIRLIESAIGGTRGWVRPAVGERSPGSYLSDVEITPLTDESDATQSRFLLRLRTFGKIDGEPNRIVIETTGPDGAKKIRFAKDISDIIDRINQGEIDNTEPYDISDPILPPIEPTVEEREPVDGSGQDLS